MQDQDLIQSNNIDPIEREIEKEMEQRVAAENMAIMIGSVGKSISRDIRNIRFPEITVNVPELKIPDIVLPEIKLPSIVVPEIKVPDIIVPEIKLPTILVPKPDKAEIKVVYPDSINIKQLDPLNKTVNELLLREYPGNTRDNPVYAVMVDDKGNLIGKNTTTFLGGGGGANGAAQDVNVLTLPDVTLSVGDIEIGAVELKDGTTDARAPISATDGVLVNLGTNNDVSVSNMIAAVETGLTKEVTLQKIVGFDINDDITTSIVTAGTVITITETDGSKTLTTVVNKTNPLAISITEIWS